VADGSLNGADVADGSIDGPDIADGSLSNQDVGVLFQPSGPRLRVHRHRREHR
jgi:hypothetical protein